MNPTSARNISPRPASARAPLHRRRVAGFSLLEVLIALFVLAIGLVSVAALQFTSKRTNFEAVQRSTAAALAQDMLERMRANPEHLFVYTGFGAGWTLPLAWLPDPPSLSLINCDAADCTPMYLAYYDVSLLQMQLRGAAEKTTGASPVNVGGLSQPTACIRYVGPGLGVGPAAPPEFPIFTSVAGEYEVVIAWRGLTRLSAPSNNCGAGNAAYDDPAQAAGNSAYRRVLSVRTYIDVAPPAGAIAVPGT